MHHSTAHFRVLPWLAGLSIIVLFGGLFSTVRAQQPTFQQGQISQSGLTTQNDASQTENILIILDSSGSMGLTLADKMPAQGEQTKLAIAKQTILNVLKNVPPHVHVGLRVYGDKASSWDPCNDSRLLAPLAPNNRLRISSELISLKPVGATPISYSLSQAIRQDFAGVQGKKTIILVSDGMETCDADPCNVMINMLRHGVNVKIDVLGFGIHDYAATRQLQCVAKSTFGQYVDAQNADDLLSGLSRALGAEATVAGQIILPKPTVTPAVTQTTTPKVTPQPATPAPIFLSAPKPKASTVPRKRIIRKKTTSSAR